MSINFVTLNTDAVFTGYNLSSRQMPMNPLGNKEVERSITENSDELRRTQSLLELGSRIAESQKTDVDKEPEGNVPWSQIMQQLQLLCSGDEEEDFNNIMEEIQFQMENAQSQYDYNYYSWLFDYTTKMFSSQENVSADYNDENPYFSSLSNMQTINMSLL